MTDKISRTSGVRSPKNGKLGRPNCGHNTWVFALSNVLGMLDAETHTRTKSTDTFQGISRYQDKHLLESYRKSLNES